MDFKPQQCKGVDTVAEAVAKCKSPVLEVKLDGWRGIVVVGDGTAELYSRTAKRYGDRVPELMAELAKLPSGTILDGEIVDRDMTGGSWAVSNVLGASKRPSTQEHRERLHYVAFDILSVGTIDSTGYPLRQRREVLVAALDRCEISIFHASVNAVFHATQEQHDAIIAIGHEGTIIKDLDAPYAKGKRGHGWFKLKGTVTIDVVITALPVDGKGRNLGQVGRMQVSQLRDGVMVERAYVNAPNDAERLEMTVHPERFLGRVMEMKHYGVTEDKDKPGVESFRHPTFIRWREDKLAEDCGYHNG